MRIEYIDVKRRIIRRRGFKGRSTTELRGGNTELHGGFYRRVSREGAEALRRKEGLRGGMP
jgi:hypothetical protein